MQLLFLYREQLNLPTYDIADTFLQRLKLVS